MAKTNNTQGFEWDEVFAGEETKAPGGFGYLKPGVYPFTVEEIEKSQSRTGKNMLKATLVFNGGAEGKSKVFFNTTIKEQLQMFLLSVGALRKGQTSTIDWKDLLEREGTACIKDSDRTGDNGVPFSEVHYFLLPEDAEMEW